MEGGMKEKEEKGREGNAREGEGRRRGVGVGEAIYGSN